MAFASQKVLWSVPQTGLCIGLTVSCGFLGKWLLLQKRFCGGFRQLFFTFTSQSPPGVKVAWIVNMSHPYKSSPRKMTHHVVAVGVFFGLLTFFTVIFVAFCAYPHAAWDFQAGPYQKKNRDCTYFKALWIPTSTKHGYLRCFARSATPICRHCFRQIKVQKHRRHKPHFHSKLQVFKARWKAGVCAGTLYGYSIIRMPFETERQLHGAAHLSTEPHENACTKGLSRLQPPKINAFATQPGIK